ncbi:uncharacterized protein Tco025E_02068 [Trypanosoma conorhini]|uniref:Uncharacterized protein n=1 Tax=Trypanosoma conorhini TaxID=83891 RepID=A0A422Q777_9TRYP|nr:uncharacterized protein Tco025E_02068 [Trypanosoma conorhini]RNF25813.1 hypothetical protein Tco025E_02068 [Trypanosoma conorhini]
MRARGNSALSASTLSPEETHRGIKTFLRSIDEPVLSGSLVAYEFLDSAHDFHWSLARVLKLGEHHALLQRWRVENGSYADVLDALQKEKERKMEEVRHCQRILSEQREELAMVRRDTEAQVERTKEEVENARRALAEVEEVWLHEAFNARLPSAGLCLALEASIAILNSDGEEEQAKGWEELRTVVRDPTFIRRLLEYCPALAKGADARQGIVNDYHPRLLKLREQILRPSVNILPATPTALESLICDWALAQLNAFIVYPEIEKSQARANEIGEAINNNIRRMKLLDTQIKHNAEQQHIYNEGYGVVKGKNISNATCLTFMEASDIAPITVPRSSITAAVSASNTSNAGVAVVTHEEAKRLLARASMHRPLLYAALDTALEKVQHMKNKDTDNATLIQQLRDENGVVRKQNNDMAKLLNTAKTELNQVQQELDKKQTPRQASTRGVHQTIHTPPGTTRRRLSQTRGKQTPS